MYEKKFTAGRLAGCCQPSWTLNFFTGCEGCEGNTCCKCILNGQISRFFGPTGCQGRTTCVTPAIPPVRIGGQPGPPPTHNLHSLLTASYFFANFTGCQLVAGQKMLCVTTPLDLLIKPSEGKLSVIGKTGSFSLLPLIASNLQPADTS